MFKLTWPTFNNYISVINCLLWTCITIKFLVIDFPIEAGKSKGTHQPNWTNQPCGHVWNCILSRYLLTRWFTLHTGQNSVIFGHPTYPFHFFSFLDQTYQIDSDCWLGNFKLFCLTQKVKLWRQKGWRRQIGLNKFVNFNVKLMLPERELDLE